MVRLLTLMPSLSNSPRMRSAPHKRPRRAMSRMRSMVSFGKGESFRGRERIRQKRRKPARCQRRTVSGCTTAIARRHVRSNEEPRSSFSLSVSPSFGRFVPRRRTLIGWRIMAFLMTKSRRERTASAATPTTWLPEERGLRLCQTRRAAVLDFGLCGRLYRTRAVLFKVAPVRDVG